MKFFKVYRENRKIIFIIFGIKLRVRNPFICYHTSICYIPKIYEYTKNNVEFVHPYGVVIHENTKIGKDCKIFQRVTIGPKNPENGDDKAPTIGNNVVIYSGAIILGDVTIPSGSIIGANAVVTKSIAEQSLILGVPARAVYPVDREFILPTRSPAAKKILPFLKWFFR